ncbi:MAG: hypothetical protein RI996_51 [Candidatus Parcubacteria bacterium]
MPLRKFLYTHILKKRIPTVQLRGRVSDAGAVLLKKYQGSTVLSASTAAKLVQKTNKNLLLEIGFGNGAHIVSLAADKKDSVVIGCEMYLDGVVRTLEKLIEQKSDNTYLITKDARELIAKLPAKSIQECYVLFPDPWPKVRHHKRRIVTHEFCSKILQTLKVGGSLVLATDWAEYAGEMKHIIEKLVQEKSITLGTVSETETARILSSTFAERAKKEGREVYIQRIIKT